MTKKPKAPAAASLAELDRALEELSEARHDWARTSDAERVRILEDIADRTMEVAEAWAMTASRKKGLPAGSPYEAEEWLGGPSPVIQACRQLAGVIGNMGGKAFLKEVPLRRLPNGQVAARVFPHTFWEKLLSTGLTADVWMQPGVTEAELPAATASSYDVPQGERQGKVALVLGAGNVSAIPVLDSFQKLFCEHQVVLLKLNPVNDYLLDFFRPALRSLIERGALRIVRGDAAVGAYLAEHPLVEEIHITGSAASHDAIVWGPGEEGVRNKAAGTPRNRRPITSELGGVGPAIVVPGPWTDSDLAYQAELIATQKLNNSGFNCVATQMLVLPRDWPLADRLLQELARVLKSLPPRPAYYPGAEARMEAFRARAAEMEMLPRPGSPAMPVVEPGDTERDYYETTEVFAPALSAIRIEGAGAEAFLAAAIDYCNDRLYGTLGANIVIHPKSIAEMGRDRFEQLVAKLRYGTIAINAWTGTGFGFVRPTWGAFPGHTLDDVQSGIGLVHNTFMFDRAERSVVEQPFRARPRPAWFVTNRRAVPIARLITRYFYRPSLARLPALVWNALRG